MKTRKRPAAGRSAPPGIGREIAAKLITLRERRGYATASDAARALGMNLHTYLHYERGDREIRIKVLERILSAWDATLLELLGLPRGKPSRAGRARRPNDED